MKLTTLTLATAALLAAISPTVEARASEASLVVRRSPGLSGGVTAVLRGPATGRFALMAETDLAPDRSVCLTVGRFDDLGRANHPFVIPAELTRLGATMNLQALYTGTDGRRAHTNEASVSCTALLNERLGFDYSMNAVTMQAGEIVAEQWAETGMHVRALNFSAGPDLAITFDSSNPTGNDGDLATPGAGTANSFAYENLLIVAEDSVDMNGDGLVDDPDDEAGGGMLVFEWDEPVVMQSVTLVDVDTADPAGATVRTYHQGVEIENHFVAGLDDNNVQFVGLDVEQRVDMLQVEFSGSGGVAEVSFMPCPVMLTFDSTTTGNPFFYVAGEIVGEQWVSEGVVISGVTANPNHPDEVLIFDTANPTGGDDDLVTPGYGPGNDTPRQQVLVLAADVTDVNNDGVVDDPADSGGGGTFTIDFLTCSTLESATVLDIDSAEPNCFFEAFDVDGNSVGTFPLLQLGDNSLQTVDFGSLPLVRRLELTLCASGALVDVIYCPTPGADGTDG